MWLCLDKGFMSVIRYNTEIIVIRARSREHLSTYFPRSEIFVSESSDYMYRIFINRLEFSTWLREYVLNNITYIDLTHHTKNSRLKKFFNNIYEASQRFVTENISFTVQKVRLFK